MKDFKADAGHEKADAGYVQSDKGYAPRCPADGGPMEQVSVRIETIDDNSQTPFSIYRCKECKRYLADGGKLVKNIDGEEAAKLINNMRKDMGRPLDEPYKASEIVLVEVS
jgi:hypothetical protein